MKFNLDNLNPGVFFPFDEEKREEGGVTIRLANSEALNEINSKCQKKKVEFRRGQRIEYTEENEILRSEMLWDYVIVDWEGIINDANGEKIPCTKENKILLMRKSVVFSSFIGNCVEKLTNETEAYEEVLEKNALK